MPVVVTGADGVLGRALVDALLGSGPVEVRATVRTPSAARELIELGVKTAVSDLLDPERLGAVLEGAHTVVHLHGAEPLDTLELLLDAAEDTGLRRIITVTSGHLPPPGPTPEGVEIVVLPAGSPTLVADLVAADRRR